MEPPRLSSSSQTPSDSEAVPQEPIGWGWRLPLLVMWAVAGFGTPELTRRLAGWRFASWPLSYWLAAQGVMVLHVAIAVFYAWLANRRERQARRAAHKPPLPSLPAP